MADQTSKTPVARETLAGTTESLRERLHEVLSALDRISPDEPPARQPSGSITASEVRAVLQARRRRARHFPEDLFADPAWDMLLELYAAELAQRRVSISNVCIGAAVPATTALRWAGTLEKKNLIKRYPDPLDGRRVYVALTAEGLRAMESYFAETPLPVAGGL